MIDQRREILKVFSLALHKMEKMNSRIVYMSVYGISPYNLASTIVV